MNSKIADDLGRLFEVGFNVGILNYINQNQIQNRFGDLYLQELKNLRFSKIKQLIVNKLISDIEQEIAKTWCLFFLEKGFFSGLNLFREYLKSWGCDHQSSLKNLEIIYYQCRFNNDNSLGTHEVSEIHWFTNLLSQLPKLNTWEQDINQDINKYKKKGEFLNADTLMLLRYKNNYRLLCLDLSVFSIHTDDDLKNIDYVEIIRNLLLQEVNYLRSKSVFSKLVIDTETLSLDFDSDLKEFFTAFKYQDKESAKSIQAGSYIYSFWQFLQKSNLVEKGIIPDRKRLVCNAVGYSDRSVNTISIPGENLELLETCYQIYREHNRQEEIMEVRQRVFHNIRMNAQRNFAQGKKMVDSIMGISPDTINILPRHTETITGFYNTVAPVPSELVSSLNLTGTPNFRQAHNQLIKRYLASDNTYLFLTGNPGIGKTTAIVDFIIEHKDEGFLFFYVSPRKQVNLDIIEKFKNREDGKLVDDGIFAINSDSNLIQDNFGELSVAYTSNKYEKDFTLGDVRFLNSNNMERISHRKNRLAQITDDTLKDMGTKNKGVLNSICQGLYHLIADQKHNQIIATSSIQSLRKTERGDTLKHLEKILSDAYNTKEDKVLTERMRNISGRIKHLFIMIDEITGDEGGAEFLQGIKKIVNKYQLSDQNNGFNTKIIVADASIVDKNVISQHLKDGSPQPNKIYFRRAESHIQPISVECFEFANKNAILINTNTYPAKSLTINYQIIVESCRFNNQSRLKNKSDLEKKCQEQLFKDIRELLTKDNVEQFIVYIQNKSKLSELIDKIQQELGKENFRQNQHFLAIHANISSLEKEEVKKYQKTAKVIFMTASGSRGLSFPKAKHILVEIPKFEIEKNLMEIIQVIYRGRGEDDIDNQDKYINFYLAERSFYYGDQMEIAVRENCLSLLNLLLILKASIMTRIQGYGSLGKKNYILIPIGGKSVFAAGDSFASKIENLITQLKREYSYNRSHTCLRDAYMKLESLMSRAKFTASKSEQESYLKIQESFNSKFADSAKTLDQLLDFTPLELAYISGGLLIVPCSQIRQSYSMMFLEIQKYANQELLNKLKNISSNPSYPENLTSAVKDGIELVEKLINAPKKSQKYDQYQENIQADQYYAFPLFAFISGDVMKQYFETHPQEPEDMRFKDILSMYIRSLYPVTNILPIGHTYEEFPFIVFNSYSLDEMRYKLFTEKYLLNSQELNVLSLILSSKKNFLCWTFSKSCDIL